ncbi:MAG: hypothetical protein HN994_08835 [Candidatus Marinimicrobia bacterium]|jgi:hypothetical protein|nr:hypothetical protein [Candidatus Neomarinimicrobiota bacterium]
MKRNNELNRIDSTAYGLSARTNPVKRNDNSIAIVIDRKSRIVMKDFDRILQIVDHVQQKDKHLTFVVATPAPVCSKTKKALKSKKILTISPSDI